MSTLKPDIIVNPTDLFQQLSNVSTTVPYSTFTLPLGTRATTGDGREFRLQQAGASNLVAGTLQQSPAIIANHQNLTSTTQAIGDTTVTVTLGATAATAGQYAGGTLIINTGTGVGQTLKIANNAAAALSSTMVVTLEDPFVIATATVSSKASLYPNNYSGTIQMPTTATGTPIGVPLYNITALFYGWIQTKGNVACLNDGGTTVGLGLAPSTNTAGALFTNTTTSGQVAIATQTGVTTQYQVVNLVL